MPQPKMTQHLSGRSFTFISWNCNGVNNPVKRSKILHHLQHLGAHIVYLQETHLKIHDHLLLRRRWVGQVFHSKFQGKARGAAILIHRSVPFVCSDVIADPNGRFVIVTGKISNFPVILANVYAPNWDNDNFFRHLFSVLPDTSSQHLILGGDFNCWINPKLDRSSVRHNTPSKSAKVIQSFMEEFKVSDPWRFFNPSGKEYSFFSQVHHTFTRIDFFLIDNRLISSVELCSYNAIVISDHAPVSMKMCIKELEGTRPPWRLNTRLLSDEQFVEFVSNQIDLFILTNKSSDVSASLLWETMKVYLRGEIISYTAYREKMRKHKLSEIIQKIAHIDNIYAVSASPDIYRERLALQAEFDILSSCYAENLMLRSRYKYYEEGDKASKLLAHQLRQDSSSHLIPQIQTSSGVTTNPQLINDHFKEYFISLYTSEQTDNPLAFDVFFSKLNIPIVDSAAHLEEPITIEELTQAITSMQNGKCPGPDGYPVEFYKKFLDKLAPMMIDMYFESFDSLKLPQTLNQASISLILKKNKDPLHCTSYRPISLLNVDFKILSKLLAIRLESILPSIISPDQTGFIKNRHSFFNIRRLFNIVYNPSSSVVPEAVISLDAEKAFDRVEWRYLFYTLEKFGFGYKFISWVRLLYSGPQASVRTNNTRSGYFPLHRSTRQGCPLSPLLFAIAIEPLSIALRSDSSIMGIKRMGTEQKVSLYADDLLLYISDLDRSIPTALGVLKSFGSISGYKLNLSKSEIFPLNSAARNYPLHNFPFKISHHRFTYLGVCITDTFKDLFKFNFSKLLLQMEKDFERWSLLPLSLAGRINSVKMNILPKFSYYFQCIPIFLPQHFFRQIDSLILGFIWNKKIPRIRKAFLQRPKILGGMALPNFQFYYWATNLRVMQYWLNQDFSHDSFVWLTMEATSCMPTSLAALVHAPIKCSSSPYTKNIIVKTTLRIWRQFRLHFGLQTSSISAPIAANFAFLPSLMDRTFSQWSALGIITFKDFYIDNVFASFQQLRENCAMPKHNFFRYLQVRSFVRDTHPQFPSLPSVTPIDSFLKPIHVMKGMISHFYEEICSLRESSLASIKSQWEEDIGENIPEEQWEKILSRVHSSSFCARQGLMQCKILHRSHWTKVRLSKIYPEVDPMCDRCHQAPASTAHMFWSCPSLHKYWSLIFKTLSEVLGIYVQPLPVTALFGTLSLSLDMPKYKTDFVAFVTLLARRLILINWKSPTPPTHSSWINDIFHFIKLEKIRHTIKGSSDNFYKIWGPFLDCVGK